MKNGRVYGDGQTAKGDWWSRKSQNKKRLIVLSILGGVILAILFVYFLAISYKTEICTSSSCVRASMEFLDRVEPKTNPCEDFYRFACANFLNRTNTDHQTGARTYRDLTKEDIQIQIRNMYEQPNDHHHHIGDRSFDLARKFYRSCMNESAIERYGLKRMKEIFVEIGGWPILDGYHWNEKAYDWKYTTHKLRRIGINFEFFLILNVRADKDPARYILSIETPDHGPSRVNKDVRRMFLDYMADVAAIFGANRERARRDQDETLQFMLALAQLSANTTTNYRPMTPTDLEFNFSGVGWLSFINGILEPTTRISHDDIIFVSDVDYIRKLLNLLGRTRKRVLANFIAWHTLQHLINYQPTKILERAYRYLNDVNGKVVRKPRWQTCLTTVEKGLHPLVTTAYIQRYFDADIGARVKEMIAKIKIKLKNMLEQFDWLDERTTQLVVRKLLSTTEEIVPTHHLNDLIRDNDIYRQVHIQEDKFLNSVLNITLLNTHAKFNRLRNRIKENWLKERGFITGLDIAYSHKENSLRFPIGLLQGIYYGKDKPEYLNYGALGMIIAREFTYLFIDSRYGKSINEPKNQWTSQSLLNYDTKLQCLLDDQERHFRYGMRQRTNNAPNGREEYMADLVGMKLSYDTYLDWVYDNGVEGQLPGLNYAPKQLFWMGMAGDYCKRMLEHETNQQRYQLNGILRNLEEFSADFHCPRSSSMNPENKCSIWS